MSQKEQEIQAILTEVGQAVCRKVRSQIIEQGKEAASQIHKEEASDVIYAIDKDAEDIIEETFEQHAAKVGGIWLFAEGVGDEEKGAVFPSSMQPEEVAWKVLMDPIDGTRCIMYDKRPAFYLSAAAPNTKESTMLSDTTVAVMVEIPHSRSHLSDILWAIKGQGSHGLTWNLETEEKTPIELQASKAESIEGGFAQLVRFFPPGRDILSKLEDELIHRVVPGFNPERAIVFEDQYISTGGQLYQLLRGHDRFTADLRHLLYTHLRKQGQSGGHVCHPYDICTVLIAWEEGLELSDAYGQSFDAPFNLHAPVDWIAYANASIRKQVEPVLLDLLKEYQLIEK